MCGWIGGKGLTDEQLRRGIAALGHRGKDYCGIVRHGEWAFAHNRLAIVDRAPRSNQPWVAPDRIICFNGELYNHANWGLGATELETLAELTRRQRDWHLFLEGQFSIGVFHKGTSTLEVARDLFGICPLYACGPVVASERRALLAVFGTGCAIQEIYPGARWAYQDQRRAWHRVGDSPRFYPTAESFDYSVFHCLFSRAVEKRVLHSNVGYCLALSGGLDSSLIAWVLTRILGRSCEAVTVYSDESGEDLLNARRLAAQLQIPLFECRWDHAAITRELSSMHECLDGVSINEVKWRGFVRNYGVAKHATSPVILSGEGADELFCGYPFFEGRDVLGCSTRSMGAVRSMRAINLDRADRAGMWHTKEYRMPFLDYAVARYVASCVRHSGKEELREYAKWLGLPSYIVSRKKYGKEEAALGDLYKRYVGAMV